MRKINTVSVGGIPVIVVILLGLIGMGWLTGCRRQQSDAPRGTQAARPVVGVSLLNLSSEFIVMLEKELSAYAEELGVQLLINDAQRNPEKQVQQVESFIARGVDAIILNPCEVDASSPAVDRALEAGIPIVNVNSETRSQPTAFVGSRDEESARLAMQFLADRLGGKGNVLMMQGFMGQAAQIKRDQGAREVLDRYPELKLLAAQTAEWDRAKAMSLMENWIQSFGDRIDAVFAQNDEMAMGAVIALEQANMKDRVLVAGVDAIADALQAVRDGRLDATVFQDARGHARAALDTVLKILRKEPFQREIYIPFQLVTRTNVDQFLR